MVSGVLQVSGFCLEIYLPSIPENRANEFGGQTLCDLWPGAFPPPRLHHLPLHIYLIIHKTTRRGTFLHLTPLYVHTTTLYLFSYLVPVVLSERNIGETGCSPE